ncbi:MAG: diguanylate cyclase [Cyanobacteria bacterium P01_D01_bin.56]
MKSLVCVQSRREAFWQAFFVRSQPNTHSLKAASRIGYCSNSQDSLTYFQQQLQQHIYLRDIIRSIHRSLAVEELYQTAVHEFMQFFQADWVFVLEKGHRNWQPLTTSCCVTDIVNDVELNAYLKLETVAPRLCQSSPIMVNAQSVQQLPLEQQWLKQCPSSWLLVPIHLPEKSVQGKQPWGLIAIGRHDQPHGWTVEQQEQARLLTDEIEVALAHSHQYMALKQDNHELKSLALTDSLTALANRRQFDTYFTTEWQRLAREKQPLTLILCDIDYFKLYNDYYGHPTGDICLTQVSRVLTHCIRRPADLVARYGGEEFAVVLPNTDTSGGHNVALAIQQGLEQEAIPHVTSPVAEAVTLTMGIATVIPKHHLSPHDLLQAADLALYHAKQQGRDRIYVHAHYCLQNDEASSNSTNDHQPDKDKD